MDGQLGGHIGQPQGRQAAPGTLEKRLLPPDQHLGAPEQGGAALFHRLDGPLGLPDLPVQILADLRVPEI